VCVCREAYTGEECAACAFGYRPTAAGGCEPVPIDCDADPLICGEHGVCTVTLMRDIKIHACECEESWDGHVCQRCAFGWQDNDRDGTCLPTCSMVGLSCESPHICSDAEGVARCACPPGYAGDDCTLCARGYHDPTASGTCTPTCSTVALDCGERQRCVDDAGDPECACIEGFGGAMCADCAPGWVEGELAGDCRPTCAAVELDCNDRGTCDDGGGFARCACDPGWAGAHCDSCARGHRGDECELCDSGWHRVGDEACVPGCSSSGVRCGSEQRCWEGADGAECVCPIGYTGAACDACDTRYAADAAGNCLPMTPAGHSLVASGTWRGQQAIVALDPAAGTVFPLREISVSALAYDPTSRRLYTPVSGGVARIDLATGTTVSTIFAPTFEALTFDTMRNALVLTGFGGTRRLDPATGSYVTLSSTSVSWASDAAYDVARDRVVVATEAGSSSLVLLSASTGASTGTLSVTWPIDTSGGIGLATTPAGQLWAIGRRRLTEDERAADACRTAARGLLGEAYAGAPATIVAAPVAGGMATLSSTLATGPELVVLRAYGDRSAAVATLRVTTANPDAMVCVGTYEGVYRIDIASGARFAAVAAESYEPTLSVRVESGYPTPPSPTVHVLVPDPELADPSLAATPAVVRAYSPEEWSDRRISLYGSSSTAHGVLVRLDPVTGAVLGSAELPGVVPNGALSPFAP
jgi:hypothetical protein